MIWTGFVAQRSRNGLGKESDFTFSGVDVPKRSDGIYSLRYAEFVVPLCKGMQEQQKQIEELKKVNEELLGRIEKSQMSDKINLYEKENRFCCKIYFTLVGFVLRSFLRRNIRHWTTNVAEPLRAQHGYNQRQQRPFDPQDEYR